MGSSGTIDPLTRVDRDALIPDRVHFFVDQIAALLARERRQSVPVTVSIANTIRMKHRTTITDDAIDIVLDWGLLERVLMFGRFAWGLNGERLWKQKVTGFLEQEVYLVGARHAAIAGKHGLASSLQRGYSNFEFADLIPHRLDVQEQSQEFVWYLIFAVYRELGRATLPKVWDQILARRPETFPDSDPSEWPDDTTLADINLDLFGTNSVIRKDPDAIARSVLAELVLYVTIDDLVRRISSLIAPHAGGSAAAFENALDDGLAIHQALRIRQLENRCGEEAAKVGDQMLADRIASGAQLADHFATFLDRALLYGIPQLRASDPMERHVRGLAVSDQEFLPSLEDRHQIHGAILAFEDIA